MRSACLRRACRHLCHRYTLNVRPARRHVSCSPACGSAHAAFLQDKGVPPAPVHLPAILRVFEAQGHSILDPTDRTGLHPLVVPLSQLANEPDAAIVGLLYWPVSGRSAAPPSLVRTSRNAAHLMMVARSVDEYLHRLLAEEDASGSSQRVVAAAVGAEAEQLYKPGTVSELGMTEKLSLYTIRKVGMFMDVCEGLAAGHLQRGDTTSALVASEWYMRGNNFPGWARPYEFASQLLHQLKRTEESRDTSRVALRLPWWTLQGGYSAAVEIAELKGSPQEVKFLLSEEAQLAVASQMGSSVQLGEPKTAQALALDSATTLMDMVAAGQHTGWDAIREELAACFDAAGLAQAASLARDR